MTRPILPIEHALTPLAPPGWHVIGAKKGHGKWIPYTAAPITLAVAKEARRAGLILTAQRKVEAVGDPQYRLLAMLSETGRRVVASNAA